MTKRSEFINNAVWPDDKGMHINAHGGGILHHEGVYYWYGEHKVAGDAGNYAQVGVHCYTSTDLYNWSDAGIALAVSEDPGSPIQRGCILERPKVVRQTGRFVMWFHLELKGRGYETSLAGVAVANRPAGPYTFLKAFRPDAGCWPVNATDELKMMSGNQELMAEMSGRFLKGGPNPDTMRYPICARDFAGGQMSRDMTLFVDDDGRAYQLRASEVNSTLHISLLTDDYLGSAGRYVRLFEHRWHEAPAICRHQGRYWLLSSGCTGWDPNEARSAVADSIFGPWQELGNPAQGVNPANGLGAEKTFGAQSTFILPVAGRPGLFIAMFDLWRPENAIDGRYVWLPMRFAADRFTITWAERWSLDSF